jgi:hypothetical protein
MSGEPRTNHHPLAACQHRRRLELETREAISAGDEVYRFVAGKNRRPLARSRRPYCRDRQPCIQFTGADVNPNAIPVLYRGRAWEDRDPDIRARRHREGTVGGERLPTPQIAGLDVGQIQGHALRGRCALDLLSVHLHAANADGPTVGQHREGIAFRHLTGHERSGRDGSEAPDRKRAIDGKAHDSRTLLPGCRTGQFHELLTKQLEPFAGMRGHFEDWRAREKAAGRHRRGRLARPRHGVPGRPRQSWSGR